MCSDMPEYPINNSFFVKKVNQAIAVTPERGDLIEQDTGYAPAEPDTYRKSSNNNQMQ